MNNELNFWLVWRDGGLSPTHRHESQESAEAEARRLSDEVKSKVFFVLKPISSTVIHGSSLAEYARLREELLETKRQLDAARREKHKAILALEKKRDGLRDGATAAAAEGRWSDTSLFSARAAALNEAVEELEEIPF